MNEKKMRLSGGRRAGCRVHPGVRPDKLHGRNSAWKERLSPQVRAKGRGRLGQGQQWLVSFSEESPQAGLCPLLASTGHSESPLPAQPAARNSSTNLRQCILPPRVICTVRFSSNCKIKAISPYKGLTPRGSQRGEKFQGRGIFWTLELEFPSNSHPAQERNRRLLPKV